MRKEPTPLNSPVARATVPDERLLENEPRRSEPTTRRDRDVAMRGLLVAIALSGVAHVPGCVAENGRFHGEPQQVNIPSGTAVLPTEWCGDFALVPVRINGQGPFTFLLDTGAGESIVTPALAARFSKDTFRIRRKTGGASGRQVAVTKALSIDRLIAGPAEFHGFDAEVIDLTGVSDALGVALDGILGCPLFEGMLLRIDFPNRTVQVRTGTLDGEERDDQFKVAGTQRPYVRVSFGKQAIRVLVDTGSGNGLSLDDKVFQRQAFRGDPVVVADAVGISGKPYSWRAGRLAHALKIGPTVLVEPIVGTSETDSFVGVKVLRHFCVTYDRKHALVRLERDGNQTITTKPLRVTGIGLRRRRDHWSIWKTYPYAGEAGRTLHEGDVVTHINDLPVSSFGCADLSSLSGKRDEITLRVQRGSTKLDVTVPVIELVH